MHLEATLGLSMSHPHPRRLHLRRLYYKIRECVQNDAQEVKTFHDEVINTVASQRDVADSPRQIT